MSVLASMNGDSTLSETVTDNVDEIDNQNGNSSENANGQTHAKLNNTDTEAKHTASNSLTTQSSSSALSSSSSSSSSTSSAASFSSSAVLIHAPAGAARGVQKAIVDAFRRQTANNATSPNMHSNNVTSNSNAANYSPSWSSSTSLGAATTLSSNSPLNLNASSAPASLSPSPIPGPIPHVTRNESCEITFHAYPLDSSPLITMTSIKELAETQHSPPPAAALAAPTPTAGYAGLPPPSPFSPSRPAVSVPASAPDTPITSPNNSKNSADSLTPLNDEEEDDDEDDEDEANETSMSERDKKTDWMVAAVNWPPVNHPDNIDPSILRFHAEDVIKIIRRSDPNGAIVAGAAAAAAAALAANPAVLLSSPRSVSASSSAPASLVSSTNNSTLDLKEYWYGELLGYPQPKYGRFPSTAVVAIGTKIKLPGFSPPPVAEEELASPMSPLSSPHTNTNSSSVGTSPLPPAVPGSGLSGSGSFSIPNDGTPRTKTKGSFMSLIRGKVSKKKKRFQLDGFDLDLSYITDKIIAMGFPAESWEGMYRNNMKDVQRFFKVRHGVHYRIYNLCAERAYPTDRFENRVVRYPFEDHNPCPYEMMDAFCDDLHQWIAQNDLNTAGIHCKAGKGRTGMMIACYLVFAGYFNTSSEALHFYAIKRTKNAKGVTIPSQIRYCFYYELVHKLRRFNFSDLLPPRNPLILQRLRLCCLPKYLLSKDISFMVCDSQGKNKIKVKQAEKLDADLLWDAGGASSGLAAVDGDVQIVILSGGNFAKKKKLTQVWFNTRFIPLPLPSKEALALLRQKSREKDSSGMKEREKVEDHAAAQAPQAASGSVGGDEKMEEKVPPTTAVTVSFSPKSSNLVEKEKDPEKEFWDTVNATLANEFVGTVNSEEVDGEEMWKFVFKKNQLDKVCKDAKHKSYPEQFRLELLFRSV